MSARIATFDLRKIPITSWRKILPPPPANREAFAALTDTAGNVPPQAVELEEAVLGALMLEKDSIIAVQEFITPEAFYTEEHRLIYKAIEELSMELKPIDLYTVTERLKVKKELKKVGGASYLAQLTQKRSRAMKPDGTPLKALVFFDASSICMSARARMSFDDCTERSSPRRGFRATTSSRAV